MSDECTEHTCADCIAESRCTHSHILTPAPCEEHLRMMVRDAVLDVGSECAAKDVMKDVMQHTQGRVHPVTLKRLIEEAVEDRWICSDCGGSGYGFHACEGRPT